MPRPTYRPQHQMQASPPEPPPVTEQTTEPERYDVTTVVWGGLNADEALERILGPRENLRTGDPLTDCLAAMRELDALLAGVPLWRRLVLHVLYDLYLPANDDVWLRVGQAIGRPKSTTYAWAHPAEK